MTVDPTTSPSIPQVAADLTPEWLTTALRASGTIGAAMTVVDATATPIGNGQVSQVLRTTLAYAVAEDGPSSIIAKLPALEEERRALAGTLGVYDTEVRFYREIAPQVDVATPALYGSAVEPGTGRFALLLEDFSDTAQPGNSLAGATTDQATDALAALADLQAPLWDSPALTSDPWWGDYSRSELFFTMYAQVVPIAEQRFGDQLSAEQLAFAHRLAALSDRIFERLWRPPFVMAHGDYRLDNMMFGTAPGTAAVTVIDWQTAKLAPPLADAAMFLGTNLDTATRRRDERALIAGYHSALLAAGVDHYTPETCWDAYRLAVLYPVCAILVTAPSMTHTDDDFRFWSQLLQQTLQMGADLESADLV